MRADVRAYILVPVLLCLMLLSAQLPSRGDTDEEEAGSVTVRAGCVFAAAGEEVTLAVSTERNTGFCGMLLELRYEARFFSFLAAELPAGEDASDGLHLTVAPVEEQTDSYLRLLWDGTENTDAVGMLVLLRFRVSKDAVPGRYPFVLSCPDSESVYAVEGFSFCQVQALCGDGAVTLVARTADFRYAGCQETEAVGKTFSVRLSGVSPCGLSGIPSFSVMVESEKDPIRQNLNAQGPYTGVCGYTDGIRLIYTAEQLGGEAVYTVCLDNLPADGEVRLFLLPCVDARQSGNGWMLLYADGVYRYAEMID